MCVFYFLMNKQLFEKKKHKSFIFVYVKFMLCLWLFGMVLHLFTNFIIFTNILETKPKKSYNKYKKKVKNDKENIKQIMKKWNEIK